MSRIICGDCLKLLSTFYDNSFDAVITDPPYGISFMGKKWDYDIPGVEFWQEFKRVSKPGAHLLCFASPRTFHRMACNIEDAGWEIRDTLMWVYGSGFPHGSNIAKLIDKSIGYEGEVIGQETVDTGMQGGHMHAGRELHREVRDVHELSDRAKEWDGWNTCLKPAWEPILMCRKPCEGSVTANVMAWNTGAINVGACRIDSSRYPANVIHDGSDEVMELFPYSKGRTTDSGDEVRNSEHNCYGDIPLRPAYKAPNDPGSAARFFYCAKASTRERGEGNDHPTVKPLALMEWLVKLITKEGQLILDPFGGSGSTLIAAKNLNRQFIGMELEEHYCDIAFTRLGGEDCGIIFTH